MRGHRSFIAGLLLLLAISSSLYGRDRQAARAAYQKAHQYHLRLLQTAKSNRTLSRYRQTIFLYRRVVDHDPTYGACDDALYAVGGLYEEMAQRFENERYRQLAIYYFEFVADQYPLTKHKGGALERARLLKPKPVVEQNVASQPGVENIPGRQTDLATVSEIRYWSSTDYTRVVIQLDREVDFQKHILSNPDRIYFDLEETRLRPELNGKIYLINDLFIKQVRVAQNSPAKVRLVLDFEEIKKHTVFALYDPFRIVIDTLGGVRPSAASPNTERTVKTQEAVISLETGKDRQIRVSETPVTPASNFSGDRSLTRVLGLKVGRVVIDPGHGGVDTGTIGPSGLMEKDLVLAVSQRLKQLLESRLATEVVLTRTTDIFVPLEERTAIANQLGADLFISVHANSSKSRKVSGVETFFLNLTSNAEEREVASRENASSQKNIRDLEDLLRQITMGDYNEESSDLARTVQQSLYTEVKSHRPVLRDRGVKRAPFIVLINLNMPGILTEVGFLSNPSDEQYFKEPEGRHQVAEALFRGIEQYLRSLGAVPTFERTANIDSPSPD
ncbi:MAG: N-acetylmuramoyl-L-alanine amidase [Acidobacteria bacterium]|nr:N-acetylmuramoyl-L-alanine amidase [Acidobacteriota bacterium]